LVDALQSTRVEKVRTLFCKYDGRPHRQMDAFVLGHDHHGLWVGSVPGGVARRGDGKLVTVDHTRVRLFPDGQWWSALFNDEPHETAVYCDIAMPAVVTDNTVTAVDLDLDVRRMRDGSVRVLDEDEFADHSVKYAYPSHVVSQAREACAWVAANITRTEPFVSAYQGYLVKARALAG